MLCSPLALSRYTAGTGTGYDGTFDKNTHPPTVGERLLVHLWITKQLEMQLELACDNAV